MSPDPVRDLKVEVMLTCKQGRQLTYADGPLLRLGRILSQHVSQK